MAQIGFGLNVNKTAQESGYDQYAVGLGDVLKATAEETWARNPLSSTSTLIELQRAALKENSPLVSKDQLNAEYGDLGLSFEDDDVEPIFCPVPVVVPIGFEASITPQLAPEV